MSDKLVTISLQVDGREVELRLPASEVSRVQEAAQLVTQRMSAYRKRYKLRDDAYLALMCCLELATENQNLNESLKAPETELPEELQALQLEVESRLASLREV
jgi:cell division protein ZapA (FtsZ GTPase activity inhibitor)